MAPPSIKDDTAYWDFIDDTKAEALTAKALQGEEQWAHHITT